jgi:hypothetical protein
MLDKRINRKSSRNVYVCSKNLPYYSFMPVYLQWEPFCNRRSPLLSAGGVLPCNWQRVEIHLPALFIQRYSGRNFDRQKVNSKAAFSGLLLSFWFVLREIVTV